MLKDGCLGCDITSGRRIPLGGIIYEDEYWMVYHCEPDLLGYLIINSKRHCEHIGEIESKAMTAFGLILKKTYQAVMNILHPDKIYTGSFGEYVGHVHFHILPRYQGMPPDAIKVFQEIGKGKYVCSEEEAVEVAAKIRQELRRLI